MAAEVVHHDHVAGESAGTSTSALAHVRSIRQHHRRSGPDRTLAAAAPAHHQPLLPVELEQTLVVGLQPLM